MMNPWNIAIGVYVLAMAIMLTKNIVLLQNGAKMDRDMQSLAKMLGSNARMLRSPSAAEKQATTRLWVLSITAAITLMLWSLTFLSVEQRRSVTMTVLKASSEVETGLVNLTKGLHQLKQQIMGH